VGDRGRSCFPGTYFLDIGSIGGAMRGTAVEGRLPWGRACQGNHWMCRESKVVGTRDCYR
jgi:hypothetical protein